MLVFTVALIRASIFFLIGGAILFINLRKLKEYKEEKEGLEYIEEEKEEYVQIDEKILHVDKKQYIPLAIYFVCMTILVVLRY